MRTILDAGDVVTVTRIDRLARRTFDLFGIVKRIGGGKAQFRSLAEPWADASGSTGRLMLAALGGLADVKSDLKKTLRTATRAKRRLRPIAPRVRVRSSDAGEITSKPMLLGYARVSTVDQNLALQRDALTEAGCAKIYTEQMPGAVTDRPALHDALESRAAATR